MTSEVEEQLWERRPGPGPDWSAVIEHLRAGLAAFLKHEVVVDVMLLAEADAFCCAIEGRGSLGGVFEVQWTGRLGMQPIDGVSKTTATLFLFSMKKRLQVRGHAGSTLELSFERRERGPGEWISLGWREDIHGEWEGARPPQLLS